MQRAASPARLRADLVLFPVFEGEPVPDGVNALAPALQAALRDAARAEFKGSLGQVLRLSTLGLHPAGAVGLVGLGRRALVDRTRLGNALHLAFRALPGRDRRVGVVAAGSIEPGELAGAAVEAAVLAGFVEATHKSAPGPRRGPQNLFLVGFPTLREADLVRAQVLAEATNLARELVNLPPSELTPTVFAARARREAVAAGLKVEVVGPAELRRLGYGALLAVAAGSAEPAQLVVMRHSRPTAGRRLALVGKGITFDTGGISIKPAADMDHMKADMGGAAAVLGAMTAIGRLGLNADVVGIMCIAENMLGPAATRPGDVVTTGSGKTVEVLNTDAEGRLVLADGLHHAVKLGATHLVDIATLTGAQRIMLGPVAGALWGSDPGMVAEVESAAAAAGERVWEMPLFPEYESMIASPIADLANSFGRDASANLAAMFLREFTAGRPWVHLDIAAPSWIRHGKLREMPHGPTGFGVRTLALLAAAGATRKSDKISRNNAAKRPVSSSRKG